MDKRGASDKFKERLQILLNKTGMTQTAFANSIEIDRSAVSQLLTGADARLPRVSTLLALANAHQVSIDWLLGITDTQTISSETKGVLDVEISQEGFDGSLMAQWHTEAIGHKIRYVPATLPDLFRIRQVIEYEAGASKLDSDQMLDQTAYQLNYSRQPESDMEVCMSVQTLNAFAEGEGKWSGLHKDIRTQQLEHMALMLEELYPSFRLYLFDERNRYTIPYTLFGYSRAAIYAGDIFLLIHAKSTIRTLAAHFDDHIRNSEIEAHQTAAFLSSIISQ